MLNRKKLVSRLAFVYFILVLLLLLIGCSGTNTIVREVPIYIEKPALTDTVTLTDTVIVGDSVWYGQVEDSLGQVIGDLKVYFQKKIAEIKLNAQKDTIIYVDTVKVDNSTNSVLPILVNTFTWWEAGLWFGGMGILTGLIAYLRLKRGKII